MERETKSSQEQANKASARKSYRKPLLARFGTITDVTAGIGLSKTDDGNETAKTS